MDDQEKESEALMHILTDVTAEPIMLSYKFIENITDNFSKDLEIGTGGFGVVYVGIVRNRKVAIKKLSRIDAFSEKQFEDELKCLKRVRHRNIVRFLGYCSDTPKEVAVYNGVFVLADCPKRFLCFEYAPNKSLEDYIKDESRQLDWDTHYQLIKGICQGLYYLHKEERINHLDLKPANILLDAGMVPKITDFGLSRRFSGEQSRIITEHVRGTPGYIAPEYINKGEISFKTDIYSLGIIISKLLIQRNEDLFDHEGWHKSADIVCSGAKECIKIAQLCVDPDQQRRPNIGDIIDMLNLMGSLKDNSEFSLEQERSNSVQLPRMDPRDMHFSSKIQCNKTTSNSKVADIYSLEFSFPFKPNKRLHCPMTLTNVTDHYVGLWIIPISANSRVNESSQDPCSFSLMKPNSIWVATVTMKEQEQERLLSRDTHKFKMMILIMGSSNGNVVSTGSDLLKLIKDLGGNRLPQAMLSAAVDNRANCKIVTTHQVMSSPRTSGDVCCLAMDMHPTEPWIIMGHAGGFVSIWNYQTQQRVNGPFQMTTCGVCSVKFIAGDQWFAVAGDAKGWVHVFFNNKKVETFEAHPDKCIDSLAVHPTYPILLSSSCEDNIIKRWDWDKGWACNRIFEGHTNGVRCLTFNLRDTNNFVSIGLNDDTKVWNINSSTSTITLSPEELKKDDYFSNDHPHQQLMISCDDDEIETAEIWDMHTKDHLQTLSVFMQSKLLENEARVNDHEESNSSDQKSDYGSEIPAPGPTNKTSVKNNGKKDSGTKENHGGTGTGTGDDANNATGAGGGTAIGDDANNATGAGGGPGASNPAGNKGKGQMSSGPSTSTPVGHPNSSIPPPGTATAGLYYQSGDLATYIYDSIFRDTFQNSMFRDDNVRNLFSDENPNSCSMM